MIPAFCIIGVLLILCVLSRLIWGRSLTATTVAFLLRVINLGAKFKANEAETRKRVESIQEKRYELPKRFHPSKGIKELPSDGMRVFCLNETSKSNLVMFYIHGGGFVEEISMLHWKFLNRMAELTDAKILVPLYPLAPHHTYEDTFPAIIELYRKTAEENKGKKIILSGDSAGGNIALVIAEHLIKDEQPDELILLSPATMMHVNSNDKREIDCFRKCTLVGLEGINVLGEYWAGGKEKTDSPYVSPYYGDVSKLKKVTMFLGERDMAYVMGLKTDEKMRKAGVDVHTIIGKGMNHVWPVQPVPEAIKSDKTDC